MAGFLFHLVARETLLQFFLRANQGIHLNFSGAGTVTTRRHPHVSGTTGTPKGGRWYQKGMASVPP